MTLPESLFRNILEISLPITAVIGLLLLLRPLLQKYYRAKWMYWVWLLLAVRLVVPVNFSLPAAPVTVPAPGMTIYRHETVRTNPGFHEFVLFSTDEYWQAKEQEDAAVAAGAEMTGGDIKNYYSPVFTLSQIGGMVWCGGVGVVLILELISYARFRRRVKRWRSPLEDPRFESLKAELGVKRLALAQCSAISSPMVTGFVHPTLLLPDRRGQAPALQGEAMEAVLRHELIHAKRHDLWYKLLLVFARAVHWFNPLVWLMERQAGQDLEISCDETVIAGRDEGFRAGYGRAILDAVDCGGDRERAPLTTYFHGGKKAMLERLQSIVSTKAKRRGVIALCLAVVLTVTISAVCAITPPTQTVDGGVYTLSIPTDIISCNLTEVMPDDTFPSSYYEAHFWRYSGSGNIRRLSVPGFADMSFEERAAALHPTDKALGEFEFFDYVSPGGLAGLEAKSTFRDHHIYFFPLGGDGVLEFSLYLGSKGTGHQGAYFTQAEADAMLASLTLGYSLIPAPKGDFALSYDFIEDEAIWYLWDTGGRNPKLLGTANVPARYRIWAAPLWSEDGRWAVVPSSAEGGPALDFKVLRANANGEIFDWPISTSFSLGGDSTEFSAAGATLDYTPLPETLELRVTEFVANPFPFGGYPALALSYSLMDTAGNLQSGSAVYPCVPPETSYRPIGFQPLTDVEQNAPCVPTQWADDMHRFSLLLPEGTTVSPADGTAARIFTDPNGAVLGRIYTAADRPTSNSGGVRVRDGDVTYLYSWEDSSHSRYYHLELRQPDGGAPHPSRMTAALTMDGYAVTFYPEAERNRGAYTRADVDSAMEAARAEFAGRDNVRLDKLWFDPERLEMIEASYPKSGVRTHTEIENMMVLLCNYTYIGELPAAAPSREMRDWMLIFVRDSADGPWVLDNEGY